MYTVAQTHNTNVVTWIGTIFFTALKMFNKKYKMLCRGPLDGKYESSTYYIIWTFLQFIQFSLIHISLLFENYHRSHIYEPIIRLYYRKLVTNSLLATLCYPTYVI